MYASGRTMDITTDAPVRYLLHRFTVDEYYRMAETGILDEDDRVELIDGQILVMEPISPEHGGHTMALTHLFSSLARDRALLSVQNPIQIDEYNHPQPDVVLCRLRDDFYKRSHPAPSDIYLVVEVAWTSAARDRRLKIALYGRAGIVEFWLVDIPHRTLEVYTEPSDDGYDRVARLRAGSSVRLAAFNDMEVRVEDVVSLD